MAVKSVGPLADDGHHFLNEIGIRMSLCTVDPRETVFLYQRVSVEIERFNAVCLANTFTSESQS